MARQAVWLIAGGARGLAASTVATTIFASRCKLPGSVDAGWGAADRARGCSVFWRRGSPACGAVSAERVPTTRPSLHDACCLEADATRIGPASASSLYGSFWADRPSVLEGRCRRLPVARVLEQVAERFGLAAGPSHASRARGREALVGLGGFRLAHDPSQAKYQVAWVAESRALQYRRERAERSRVNGQLHKEGLHLHAEVAWQR